MSNNDLFSIVENQPRQDWLRLRVTRYSVAGVVGGILFPIIASMVQISVKGLPITLVNLGQEQLSDPLLWIIDSAPLFLGLLAGIAGRRQDLVLQANKKLTEREAELNSIRANLEQGIQDQTRELDERNAQMRSVVAFARQVADIHDIESLLPASVAMIAERFARRDARLFLLNESGQWAILKAASSPAGRDQMKDGFRVAVGDQSIVGRVAKRGKLLVAPARSNAAEFAASSLTRTAPAAELALPLVVRGKLIGVLDIQSQESRPIGQREIEMLQLLADQLAASIENARLVNEANVTVARLEALSSQATRDSWLNFVKRQDLSYQFTPAGVQRIPTGSAATPQGALRLPLTLRGEEIGSIILQRKAGDKWNPTEQDLLKRLTDQVALALENARLLEETRLRASQERTVSEISARFSHSLDVDALLQTAVREFASLPEVTEAAVYLTPAEEAITPSRIPAK
ncbi:MAG: GAF domain-containing protein [Anaerolineales bacterium]